MGWGTIIDLIGGIGGGVIDATDGDSGAQGPEWVNLLQENLTEQLLESRGDQITTPSRPFDSFVGMTPIEQAYFDHYATQEATTQSEDYWDMGDLSAYEDKWSQTYNPAYDTAWEDVSSGLSSQFEDYGFHSADTEQALSEAGEQFALDKGTAYGDYITDAYSKDLQVAKEKAELYEVFSGQDKETLQQQADLERSIEEARIADLMARWYEGEEVRGAYNPMYTDVWKYLTTMSGQNPLQYENIYGDTSWGGLAETGGNLLGDLLSSGDSDNDSYDSYDSWDWSENDDWS